VGSKFHLKGMVLIDSFSFSFLQEFLAAHPIITVCANVVVYAVIGGGIYAGIENWEFMDGVRNLYLVGFVCNVTKNLSYLQVYFSIITGTTVGFGDISPKTVAGRWISVVFLPFAVIYMSTQLSQLANIVLGRSEDSKLKVMCAYAIHYSRWFC
jgi:CBS domain containing-hemolysin-like protein